jgi:hypothetical protein
LGQTGTGDYEVVQMSIINTAIEAVMDLIDALGNFAPITRGALGTGDGLTCEVAPSTYQEVYLDKNAFVPLTLALNGKHHDLQLLSNTMNNIIDTLTRRTAYPAGDGWQIVDITSGNLPRII